MGQNKGHNINSGNIRVASEIQKNNGLSVVVFDTTGIVGNNGVGNGGRYKFPQDGKLGFFGTLNNIFSTNVKRVTKMGETKLVLWMLDMLGVPSFVLGFVVNIGTWKGWVMFVIGTLYGIARLFFYVWRNVQEAKSRELDIKNKEFDFTEKTQHEEEDE